MRTIAIVIAGVAFTVLLMLLPNRGNEVGAQVGLLAEPTPGPQAMTVYMVTNTNPVNISVRHIITDSNSFRYEFTSTVPANSAADYHLRDFPSVPSPFNGAMTLQSDQQFTAAITGYDYPITTTPTSTATSTPTRTPTSTPTYTPAPTSTPTYTPGPAPTTGNLTLPVSSSSDDVNEDNTSYDSGASSAWLGNASSATSSYTGFRFANVAIPQEATIDSAYLSVYSPQTTWMGMSFSIAAENTGNSLTFSSSSRPSQRSLTTDSVSHSSDVSWQANTWYDLDEIKSVVQEVVNRADWQNGNSLSIILKGTAGPWARKFIGSYDGNAQNATKLVVSYSVSQSTPTSTPTNTPVSTSTPTSTPIPTSTPASTPIPTNTPASTPIPTITPTYTPTPSIAPTQTPTPTATSTETPTPTSTPTTVRGRGKPKPKSVSFGPFEFFSAE